MDVSKNRGKTPKMDGENNGSKPYEQIDDLGAPLFLETPIFFVETFSQICRLNISRFLTVGWKI